MIPLFESFPHLAGKLAYKRLGHLPTPLETYEGRSIGLACDQLLIKCDDKSGEFYGGNKVRKLEFLLADAIDRSCDGVVTFGTAGSNHALATAVYARQCGLRCYSMLTPQPVASVVRRNLMAGYGVGNRLMGYESYEDSVAGARALVDDASSSGLHLCTIRGGGSSPLGCLGFVNAALELSRQIAHEGLKPPDVIYVALGTMGTVTGLMLGLHAAGIDCRVVAVRVVADQVANDIRYERLYRETSDLLCKADPQFPARHGSIRKPEVRHEYFGPGYGCFTPESMQAVADAHDLLGLRLEGTYTGKTFAALLADLRAGQLDGKNVLFWNTYNSVPLAVPAKADNYRDLPPFFHRFFEQPVQPLDPGHDP
jgi:1-aminocyclopropane-1-carboxylate deaminase/D-cysteine desulfhydrase-like pyridoxal-dependent ACC family enzyme